MRAIRFFIFSVFVVAVAAAGRAVEVVAPDEVPPGSRGVCLTEMDGGEMVEIPVTVLGTVGPYAPDQEMVLIRLDDRRFEKTGIIAGMSGSPVYVDGRLLGALAFGWGFSVEPIGGVTPFAKMIELGKSGGAAGGATVIRPKLGELIAASREGRLDELLLDWLAPKPTGSYRHLPLAVSMAGPGVAASSGWIGEAWDRMGWVSGPPAAGTGGASDEPIRPGSMVAAVLVDGDITLGAGGTVTEIRGDQVWAFGHPFLGGGAVEIPMARAKVVTVLPSLERSFKFFEVGAGLGLFKADRTFGVWGRLGLSAPMVPVRVDVDGRSYAFRTIRHESLLPSLVGYLANSSLEARGRRYGNQTVVLNLELHYQGGVKAGLTETFVGGDAGLQAAGMVAAAVGYLENSSFTVPQLEEIRVDLKAAETLESAVLVSATPERWVVAPGERLPVRLRLRPHRGVDYTRTVHITVPKSVFLRQRGTALRSTAVCQPRGARTRAASDRRRHAGWSGVDAAEPGGPDEVGPGQQPRDHRVRSRAAGGGDDADRGPGGRAAQLDRASGGSMRVIRVLGPILVLMCSATWATETRRWVVDTPGQFLKGRGDGVAVTEDGRLVPVPGWTDGAVLDEPIVAAGGRLSDGSLIVGTGHPARLYRVKGARASLLTDVPGEQVTAVLVTPGDEVYVASLSPGVLFRLDGNELEEVARLGEGGIWDLAWFGNGVIAATGMPATLYRLGDRGLERWVELPDAHARSLSDAGDTLVVGTSGKGLILGVDPSGQVALLADSPFTEIPDLEAVPDGSVWAVALVGEPVKPPAKAKKAKKANGVEEKEPETNGTGTATVELDLPKIDGATATSELLRLTPDGALLHVHRFAKQVASSVAWDGSGVLVGTGYQGEVWRFLDEGGARLTTVDAVQVVGVVDGGAALLTQGPGRVLWRRSDKGDGRYRIDAQWLPIPVRFGEYSVTPATGGARIRFRSGVSQKPDDSWLPWTEWLPASGGTVPLPVGRSIQWEVDLEGGTPVERVVVAFREINLAPQITTLSVEEPGVVYLAAPPPTGPVIDRDHPDVNGIFTVIDPRATAQKNAGKGKKYYRMGFRTVRWTTKDLNEDALRFRLEVEREDGFELEVRDRLVADQLGVDTTALPDGTYRFRLTASDAATNPGNGLEATRSSRWFVVDNTPPTVTLTRSGGQWHVTVEDASSAVSRAEWSRDGEKWHPLAPTDGILDGQRETFSFDAQDGRHLVVVRAVDRHLNRTTAGAVE